MPEIFAEFDEDDPRYQVRILAMRVENLGKEKETLEKDLIDERKERKALDERVAKMERSFERGAGIVIALPIIGGLVGILMAYGKTIFGPWIGK